MILRQITIELDDTHSLNRLELEGIADWIDHLDLANLVHSTVGEASEKWVNKELEEAFEKVFTVGYYHMEAH